METTPYDVPTGFRKFEQTRDRDGAVDDTERAFLTFARISVKRGGDHDYMMRSEKRPGQRPAAPPPRRKRRKRERHPVYAFFTVLALTILYPIGLVLLWVRKLRWSVGTKLLVSIATGIVFFLLAAYALTADVSALPYLSKWQTEAKKSMMVVLEATRTTVSDTAQIRDNLVVQTPRIGLMLAQNAARVAGDGAQAIQDNIRAMTEAAPDIPANLYAMAYRGSTQALRKLGVLAPTPEPQAALMPMETPGPAAEPTPGATPAQTSATPAQTSATPTLPGATSAQTSATPTLPSAQTTSAASPSATETARVQSTAAAKAEVTNTPGTVTPSAGTPQLYPTSEPRPVPAVAPVTPDVKENPTPTLAPTLAPTVAPTLTPTPIPLPTIKPLSLSRVYYYDSGKYYHTYPTCSGMEGAPLHTLAEAIAAGKKPCKTCTAPDAALLEAERVVFCGEDAIFHVTDECPAITQKWSAKTMEEAFMEDGYFGCPLCGSDLYMEAARQKPENTPVPAPAMVNPGN